MIATWIHPVLKESLERYNRLLNAYYILEIGQIAEMGTQLEIPSPPSFQELFAGGFHGWHRGA